MNGEGGAVLSNRQQAIDKSLQWYALKVRSQKEHMAKLALQQMGFGTRVPEREKWRHANGYTDRRQTKFPLMYGMIFVGFPRKTYTDEELVNLMNKARRPHFVHKFMGINGRPFEMSAAWIDALENGPEAIAKLYQKRMRYGFEYEQGDVVKIATGPFTGFEGLVENVSEQVARLTVMIFGRWVPVEISVSDAIKAA
jgi:transcriptional antiterminator NusG